MAKDAKGHGSEARSGPQHAIARDTVKNPLKGVFLGGPNPTQAEGILRSKFGYSDKEISDLKGSGDPRYDAIVARNPELGGLPAHQSGVAAAQDVPRAALAPLNAWGVPTTHKYDKASSQWLSPAMRASKKASRRTV